MDEGYSVTFDFPPGNGPASRPYLVPPGWSGSDNIQFDIPGVAGPGCAAGTCSLPSSSQVTFSLDWSTNSANAQVAQITIASSAVSSDGDDTRKQLLQDFQAFRQQLATLEATADTGPGCLIAGGADIIANRVALALPLRLGETLSYYYNFNRAKRYVDLVPGMRLRVDPAGYSYSGDGANPNGYVSAGTYFLNVTVGSVPQTLQPVRDMVLFDSWAGAIAPSSVDPLQPAGNGTEVLGLVDLSAQGMARRHWRLIWPSQFAGVPSAGDPPSLIGNVAFLGANNLADLEDATTQYVTTGLSPSNTSALCTFFSGRAAVVPEITIYQDSIPRWVPVGTTLRQLALQAGLPSLTQLAGPGPGRPGAFQAQLTRWSQSANGAYLHLPVTFTSDTAAQFDADGLTQWDVPLTFGDRVTFTQA